jgi:hypothetical protein
MKNLTDELRIINASIDFATKNNLDYQITRYPTNYDSKEIEINLGKGPINKIPKMQFAASFITRNEEIMDKDVHIYPIDNNCMKEAENFRQHLRNSLKDIEFKW